MTSDTIPSEVNVQTLFEQALEALKAHQITREEFDTIFPSHTCVENPNLACPACTKWADQVLDSKSFDNGI